MTPSPPVLTRIVQLRLIVSVLSSILFTGCSRHDWTAPDINDPYVVLQRNDVDCGIAAVTTMLKLHNRSVDYDAVSALNFVKRRGLSLKEVAELARRFGLMLAAYSVSTPSLDRAMSEGPLIVLLGSVSNGHYVVVRRIVGDTATVYDPEVGLRAMRLRQFRQIATGIILREAIAKRSVGGTPFQ